MAVYPRRTIVGTGSGPFYSDSVGFVQRKPYRIFTEHQKRMAALAFSGSKSLMTTGSLASFSYGLLDTFVNADNKAYSKLIANLRQESSSLGITLGEHRSAKQMMTKRAKDLVDFLYAVRRKDWSVVRRAAVENYVSSSRRQLRWKETSAAELRRRANEKANRSTSAIANEVSSNILEWSWGWRPMYEDIVNSLEVLVSPLSNSSIRGKSGDFRSEQLRVDNYDGPGYGVRLLQKGVEKAELTYRVKTGCKVTVANPNVVLANRLGLINPLGIFWATLPFSFLVDKIVNVGSVINSLTDTYGFTLTEQWTSRSIQVGYNYQRFTAEYDYSTGLLVSADSSSAVGFGKASRRQTGILRPLLSVRYPSFGSFSEVVSYFALLTQLLTKK